MVSNTHADVIIVGAGISGLQAARSLDRKGFTTLVLEARPRIGGKALSIPHADGTWVADLGAEWINDTTQPNIYQLAVDLGLEFEQVAVRGDSVLEGLDGDIIRHAYDQQAPVCALSP